MFPALPGVTSVAETFADIMRQAKDALASAVQDMEQDGEVLWLSTAEDAVLDYNRAKLRDPLTLLVRVVVSA